ncbi:MAG: sugar ABC transporter permease [Chloroflexota bacterium]
MAVQESTSLTGEQNPRQLFRAMRSGTGPGGRKSPTSENVLGYLFIAPAVLLYLTFNVWPLIRGILMAFTDYRFVYPDTRWAWNGVDNFVKLFGSTKVREALWVSFQYTGLVVPAVLIAALLSAVLISQVRRGAGFYRWVVYLPTILPVAVSFLMFQQMYALNFGIINVVLRRLGMEDPPHWLGEVETALPAIGAAHTWIIFGFPTLLFLIGIYGISAEMYEAASLDGANRWQQFRFITLPQLKPTTAMVLILTIPGIFTVTDPMLILTQGGPQGSTQTLGYYLYSVAFQRGDLRLGYASAISLVVSFITAALVALVFLWSREPEGR